MAAANTTPTPEEAALEDDLLRAHQSGDTAMLATLYASAAKFSEAAGRTGEAGYRYTQAYVYALECGALELSVELRRKLVAQGREE